MELLVIGGGAAGMMAALAAAEQGVKVTLLERNQHITERPFDSILKPEILRGEKKVCHGSKEHEEDEERYRHDNHRDTSLPSFRSPCFPLPSSHGVSISQMGKYVSPLST